MPAVVTMMTQLTEKPRASSTARRFLRDTLANWGIPQGLAEQAELVVSELVANAIKHTSGVGEVHVRRDEKTLVIEVTDQGGGCPEAIEAGSLEEGHRGLFIVQAVSSRWGYRDVASGKAVWAEFDLTR